MSGTTPTPPVIDPAVLATLMQSAIGRKTVSQYVDDFRKSRAKYIESSKPRLEALEETARQARAAYELHVHTVDKAIEQCESALASTGELAA